MILHYSAIDLRDIEGFFFVFAKKWIDKDSPNIENIKNSFEEVLYQQSFDENKTRILQNIEAPQFLLDAEAAMRASQRRIALHERALLECFYVVVKNKKELVFKLPKYLELCISYENIEFFRLESTSNQALVQAQYQKTEKTLKSLLVRELWDNKSTSPISPLYFSDSKTGKLRIAERIESSKRKSSFQKNILPLFF